tara:strand:+ start:786 stop:1004 length:219 start_codon:yes stop_codon:yes gene_type:complete
MASKDVRRLNPGIQVDLLYVGVGTKVDPHLVKETSDVAPFGLKNSQILSGGANPNFAYAITTSGSLVLLDPA